RYVALAYPADTPVPEEFPYPHLVVDPARLPQLLTKFHLHQERPLLILCPGAEYGPAKRWPENYYAEVAAAKISAGWQVWLMGSAKDQPVAHTIRAQLDSAQQDYCHNLAGITQLDEAIDLMSLATAVLTNDCQRHQINRLIQLSDARKINLMSLAIVGEHSGLMHIAAALQRPLVVLYGSTSPGF